MNDVDIILIAAIGKQGQLGLNGGLPWGRDFPEDRLRFRIITDGHVLIVGQNTYPSIINLGRQRILILDDPKRNVPDFFLEEIGPHDPSEIFIVGGAKTYARWMPYVTRFDITKLPYDGPADVWMPPLFQTGAPA